MWGKTHDIRLSAQKAEIEKRLEEVNRLMLNMPRRYKIGTDANGRSAQIIEQQETHQQ